MTQQKPKRIFLIINQKAGHGKGMITAESVISYLKEQDCFVEHAFTQYPGHATELSSKAAADGFDLVVAIGGDGTAKETAQGLIGTS